MCNGIVFIYYEIYGASTGWGDVGDSRWSQEENFGFHNAAVRYVQKVILITHGSNTSAEAHEVLQRWSWRQSRKDIKKSGNNKSFQTIWTIYYFAGLYVLF
jgi:hypothetical protein